jgi:hypothetical protein
MRSCEYIFSQGIISDFSIRLMFSQLVLLLGFESQIFCRSQAQMPRDSNEPEASNVDWGVLRREVGGRLLEGIPFAQPCFSGGWNSSECLDIQDNYTDECELSLWAVVSTHQWTFHSNEIEKPLCIYSDPMGNMPDIGGTMPFRLA